MTERATYDAEGKVRRVPLNRRALKGKGGVNLGRDFFQALSGALRRVSWAGYRPTWQQVNARRRARRKAIRELVLSWHPGVDTRSRHGRAVWKRTADGRGLLRNGSPHRPRPNARKKRRAALVAERQRVLEGLRRQVEAPAP